MPDRRPVSELTIEELEQILLIRKREQRMARFRRNGGGHAPISPAVAMTTVEAPSESAVMPPPALDPAPVIEEGDSEVVRFVDDQAEPPIDLPWRKLISVLLLVIEIGAVAALTIVLYQAFIGLSDIQETTNETQRELEAARAVSRTTPTPIPFLSPSDLVIPGGHTPPDENGRSSFNYVELDLAFDKHDIPLNVRPALLQELTLTRAVTNQPEPTDRAPQFVDIPQIGVNGASIFAGADWATLRAGVGWYNNGTRPGEPQNLVLVGHNDIYGEIFKDLHRLKSNDEVSVYDTMGQRYTYRVTETDIVEPTDVWVLDPHSTGAHLTLITCWPYQVDNQRYIVFAELVE